MPIKRLSQSGLLTFEKYSSMLAGNAAFQPGGNAYEWLETTILPSSQATVVFSNLNTKYASTYQHLQLRATMRSTRSDTDSLCYLQFNSSTSTYSHHFLRGTGSAVQSEFDSPSYPSGILLRHGFPGGTNSANLFGGNIVDILDPFESTKNTTIRAFTGQAGTFNRVSLESGAWFNTNIITTITLDDIFGDFAQYSRFSLYGLRSA